MNMIETSIQGRVDAARDSGFRAGFRDKNIFESTNFQITFLLPILVFPLIINDDLNFFKIDPDNF